MKRTLKSVLLVAFLSLTLFVLTGCANVNYEIKLERDGSGEVSYIMGYDKAFLSSMQVSVDDIKEDDSFDEVKQEATNEGYTIEEYEDESTYGFKAYKHVNNIQNEFKIDEDTDADDGIKYEKTLFKTKYSQNLALNLSDIIGEEEDALTKAILGQMKISYKIVLPFKVGENNATTVSEDGKTVEWILKAGEANEVKFVAEEDSTSYVVAGTGVVVLIIALCAIVVVTNKKKGKKQDVKVKKPVEVKKETAKEEKPVEIKKETTKEKKPTETKKEIVKEEKDNKKKEK